MIQALDYSKYSESSIRGLCHLMLSILYQIHIFDAPDTPFWQLQTRLFPAKPLCIQLCIRTEAFKMYTRQAWSPLVPAFDLCHLATTLAIQWRSWCLIIKRRGQLYPNGFSTSPPTITPKDGKPHALTSRQSVDKLDNLSCVRISEWKYTFQVTYVLVAMTSFHLNRWHCWYSRAEFYSEKGKCGSQDQDSSRYLSRDFNSEGHNIINSNFYLLAFIIRFYSFCI